MTAVHRFQQPAQISKAQASSMLTLLHAGPYEIGGHARQGKIHCIREAERTYCGTQLRYTGGKIQPGAREEISCKGCLRSLETTERQQQETLEWKEHWAQLAAEREQKDQEWWDWYTGYLQSAEWTRRRQAVLARANGLCEGCRERPAAHVHHLTYEHAGNELLFELVAVCRPCHQVAHPQKVI